MLPESELSDLIREVLARRDEYRPPRAYITQDEWWALLSNGHDIGLYARSMITLSLPPDGPL